jgi:hypothetical protein
VRAVLDEYMLEMMYELPERERRGVTYIVDGDAIDNELALDELPQRLAKESA